MTVIGNVLESYDFGVAGRVSRHSAVVTLVILLLTRETAVAPLRQP
jgi:hypothetical protein